MQAAIQVVPVTNAPGLIDPRQDRMQTVQTDACVGTPPPNDFQTTLRVAKDGDLRGCVKGSGGELEISRIKFSGAGTLQKTLDPCRGSSTGWNTSFIRTHRKSDFSSPGFVGELALKSSGRHT